MRTGAYLAAADESRMRFFASRGVSMETFLRHRVGPVVLSDELSYRAELRLLEQGEVRLELRGLSTDGARFAMCNQVVRDDGRIAATINSTIGWLDLDSRRLTIPPEEPASGSRVACKDRGLHRPPVADVVRSCCR